MAHMDAAMAVTKSAYKDLVLNHHSDVLIDAEIIVSQNTGNILLVWRNISRNMKFQAMVHLLICKHNDDYLLIEIHPNEYSCTYGNWLQNDFGLKHKQSFIYDADCCFKQETKLPSKIIEKDCPQCGKKNDVGLDCWNCGTRVK